MRPVSIASGVVFALILTGAAAAAPLNPQPLPPRRHAPNAQQPPARQATPTFFVVCASPRHGPTTHKTGGAHGQGAPGGGKGHSACGAGRR